MKRFEVQVQSSRPKGQGLKRLDIGRWMIYMPVLFVIGLAMVVLTIPAPAQAQAQTPMRMRTMVTLFDLESGARPLGMGGAFTGLSDDENALFYNPAGLAYLGIETRFSSFYEGHFGLTDYGQMALAARGMGLGVLLFNSRPIVRRDERGEELGRFSYSAVGLAAAYATTLGGLPLPSPLELELPGGLDRLALGARLKLYRVKTLKEGSGLGLALDPSVMFELGRVSAGGLELESLRLGLVLENLLGLPVEFGSGHREHWPLGFRLGGSLSFRGLIVAADLESDGTFHLGGEYRLAGMGMGTGIRKRVTDSKAGTETGAGGDLSIRGGLLLGGGRASFSTGLGLRLNNFRVDYALAAHPQLPLSHLLAFTTAFNLDP